jgi:hypothetical protein
MDLCIRTWPWHNIGIPRLSLVSFQSWIFLACEITDPWCFYSAKRIAIFHMTALLGTAFSGYLVWTCQLLKTPSSDIYKFFSKLQYTKTSTEFMALRVGDGNISSAAYVLNDTIGSWNVSWLALILGYDRTCRNCHDSFPSRHTAYHTRLVFN